MSNLEIKILDVHNEEWELFNKKQLNTLFVQSSYYGKFYQSLGEDAFIITVFENSSLIAGSLVLTTHAKRGNFLYLPYGPILPLSHTEAGDILKLMTDFLLDYAKKHNYSFIRVSPFIENTPQNYSLFRSVGFKSAPMHVLAETTWVLDLNDNEENLLSRMNKNHRNLIRRCEKEGVKIEKRSDQAALSIFNELHDITANRHKFHRFSANYINKEFLSFPNQDVLVWNAFLPDGQLDSSAIIFYYGQMAAYRHGASQNLNNKIPTSYLLQWNAILEAKKRGMKLYNFWGIAPDNASTNHPFKGITHFKKGFGGRQIDLIPCQDLPVNYKYWFNWLVETFRRLKRGF